MDYSLEVYSVHGILQARTLEWVTIPFFKRSSRPRDLTFVSCIADRFFTAEPLGKPLNHQRIPTFIICHDCLSLLDLTGQWSTVFCQGALCLFRVVTFFDNIPSLWINSDCRDLSFDSSQVSEGLPGDSDGKESACNAGNLSSIPESGRSPGDGYGNPLYYYCLENPMDRGAWRATDYGVTKSQT